ncbi:acetylneuraminate ABC transporter [Photobacterium iliopiscarium]|jgi:SSS family solute:Na+ symporter|uniref:Acetylneuraminate ABC transporter n=1 Tax=Photobacterium iliopiscarium TaxID=56192 RepID=A0ABX5GXT5_9GAMM|nr:sodium:solute symporter [Photobacterium iliopiscarium]KJG13929.1 acetylneuraminate ABC transporter [Photobacterium iliopiscarium]KJG26729.1 acetylneuraminate ABC transporter [Photobacterium iliopiscarium]PST96292.1 acetylneuraminate ABC transporter [Photobacterium iliopiscarium]PST99971.1 acetylneuraminate ABC transporter [Photobacterium iliopiscarium]PSV85203.1 acetylneuraminate ABC transporter [Photobacterium iliopiscarium]
MEIQAFGTINYIVLFAYLIGVMLVGVYFARRQKTADDYFKAGGRIPGWAAGISVFATTLSSITFMSIPAKAYTSDWTFLVGQYLAILILPLVFYFYIPFFRKLNLTSVYEYLERRFDIKMRLFASISFMLFHIGRIAIITYLTALALMPFVNIDPLTIVFLIGVLCIVYTFLGGIEGVIWTDVIQGIMLSVAAVLIFITICFQVDGGVTEVFRLSAEQDKYFPSSSFEWSWTNSTLPVLIIGFLFANLQQFTASQDVVQRYIVTDSIEETKKTLITNAKLVACVPVFFFAIGSALYAFYSQNTQLLPENFNTGGILPFYVISQMPAGIAGLIIAAIFAASQSSISSSLNSISACFTIDIYNRFGKEKDIQQSFNTARIVTVIAGVLGVAASVYLIKSNESQIWDAFNSLLGLMGGPMTGLFMLGIFVRRANANSALCGVIAAVIAVLIVRGFTDLNFFFYGVIGTLMVVVVGFITAPLFKNKSAEELALVTE